MPADSVSIRIYSGIARFPCDSMAFLFLMVVYGADFCQQSMTRYHGRVFVVTCVVYTCIYCCSSALLYLPCRQPSVDCSFPRRVDSMIRDARTKKVYTVWLSVRRTITVHDGLCDRTSTVLRRTRRSSWTRTLTTRPYNTASVKATSQTCFSLTSPRASRKIITLHPCRSSLGHFNF